MMTLSRSTHNSDDDLPAAAEKNSNSPPPRTASLSPPLPVRQENGKVYVGGDPNCLAPPLKRKLSPPTPENEEIDGGAKTRSNGHANGVANGLAINERLDEEHPESERRNKMTTVLDRAFTFKSRSMLAAASPRAID